MAQKKTIESLISTSVDDDFDGLPLFNQGNIIKRISKEEIQGWSQTYHRLPFQKKQPSNRWRKQSINSKRHSQIQQNFQSQDYSPPSLKTMKKRLNNYQDNNTLLQDPEAFHTMSYFQLKETNKGVMLPKVIFRQQPKQDYVKGVKFMNFITQAKKTKALKPIVALPKPIKKETDNNRSKSVSLNKVNKKNSSKDNKLSLISYPLDIVQSHQNDHDLTKNKMHIYMRKYQIEML